MFVPHHFTGSDLCLTFVYYRPFHVQAALKARDRLSTLQAKDVRLRQQQHQKSKRKKGSLKRRPTFYRTPPEDKPIPPNTANEIEVDIGVGVVAAESGRSGSMSSKVKGSFYSLKFRQQFTRQSRPEI